MTARQTCDVHAPGDPLCLVQDATPRTFYGRMTLHDGPDYGHVYEVPAPSRESVWSLLAQLLGALIVLMLPITIMAYLVVAR